MLVVTDKVNGINSRLSALLQYPEERQPEVVCLQELKAPHAPDEPARQLFLKGLLANAINPKVLLFFLPAAVRGRVARDANWQIAWLGLTFTLQATLLFGMPGHVSGTIGQWLNRMPRARIWLDRVAGAIFVGLGLRLIVAR